MSTDPRSVVDWSAAAEFSARLAPPGPRATRDELDELVGGLHVAASDAVEHVLTTTRMVPVGGVRRALGGARDGAAVLGPVHVVDRARWARANTQVMAVLTTPVAAALDDRSSQAARLGGAIEVGTLLALLAPRVLGQFDPYASLATAPAPGGVGTSGDGAGPSDDGAGADVPGRLLLVAPNILHAERALRVDPHDFRLWVCLHEQTHALQFAAAPWLAAHLHGRVSGLLEGMARTAVELTEAPWHERLATAGRAVVGVVAGTFRPGDQAPFERLLTDAQRAEIAEIAAVMALLEGHADVMMDAVGPRVVRTVRHIRGTFERRRDGEGASRLDAVLRRLLGMDAKLAQYRDGAAFVRAVERRAGRDGLNAVWTTPDALPTAREIADPSAWVRRVRP